MKVSKLLILFLCLFGFIYSSAVKEEDLTEICKDVIEKEAPPSNVTLQEFIDDLGISQEDHGFFLDYILDDKLPSYTDIPKPLMTLIIIIAFLPVCVLTWIFFWICCLCGCGIFKKKDAGECFKLIVFFLAICFFSGVIVASIASFATSRKFVKHINSLTCSFAKFYYHAEFGENTTETPRWIGLDDIVTMANRTRDQIEIIKDHHTETFKDMDSLIAQNESYYNTLVEMGTTYNRIKLVSPDEDGTVTPKYANEFNYHPGDPITEDSTYLDKIANEYIEKLVYPITILKTYRDSTADLDTQSKEIIENMETISKSAAQLQKSMDDIGSKTFTSIKDYRETANKRIFLFFQVLFGMFMAFAVILLVVLVLYTCTQCCLFKFLLLILWNILLAFIVLGFTVCLLFGILSEASAQLPAAVGEVLTYDYLTNESSKIHIDNESANLLDICLNQDGDLATGMNISFASIEKIDELYLVMDNLTKVIEDIEELDTSEAIKNSISGMNEYHNDYSLVTDETEGDKDVNAVLKELNGYTDKNLETTENCGTEDRFVSIKEKCPEGYTYFNGEGTKPEGKNCLLVKDWNDEKIGEAYAECIEYVNNIKTLVGGISKFEVNNTDTSQVVIDSLSGLSDNYNAMIPTLNSTAAGGIKLGNEFLEIFKPIMSKEGFNSVFNCNFIKKDMINFMDILYNEFYDDCRAVCIGTFIAAAFSYLGLFALVISVYRHGKKEDEYKRIK
ncbi:MAG: hypothetical protein MJ252_07450 [archaeon]|nr:hypothetical protein [archaeon]